MKKTIIVFIILAFMLNCKNKSNDAEPNNDLDEKSQAKSNLVDEDRIEFSKATPLEKLVSRLNLNNTEKETLTFLTNLLKEKLVDPNIGLHFKNSGGDESKIEESVQKFLSELKEDEIKDLLAKIKENKDKKEKDPEELNTYKSILASGFDGIFNQADSKTTLNNLKDTI